MSPSNHDPNGPLLAIHSVVIREEYRRRGIGQKLMRACEEFVQGDMKRQEVVTKLDTSKIYLRVEKSNEAGVRLYRGMGYQEVDARGDDTSKIVLLCKNLLTSTRCPPATEPIRESETNKTAAILSA